MPKFTIEISDVKTDCRNFRGHIPCKPNKEHGVMCNDCSYYDPLRSNILIIKLGAAGDVIRTTPLLYPIKEQYPQSKIIWLTYSPELVPSSGEAFADEVLAYNLQNVSYLMNLKFEMVINLDKDKEAISLINDIDAEKKLGFIMKDGVCYPADDRANEKYLTGLFDNISLQNEKTYLQEIFEICGYVFKGEKYILSPDRLFDKSWDIDSKKKVVGLNTGCGERWTSRLWNDENWIELINQLTGNGYEVVLLGGRGEDEKNSMLRGKTSAKYFGYYDLKTFINLMNKCDLVVSQVTMGMHIALGLGKKLVLLNNIFNKNEFELYGLGKIVEPEKKCICFFRPVCINPEYKCMEFIKPDTIFNSVNELLLA
ncbi:hypothetical protein BH10BAC5_BH10BAC5_22620 [soil metagenome]